MSLSGGGHALSHHNVQCKNKQTNKQTKKKQKPQDTQRSEKRGLHLKEETVHRNKYGNDSDVRIITQGFQRIYDERSRGRCG